MCGLVGIGKFSKNCIGFKEMEIFQQSLISGQVRGNHGTGVFKVHENGDTEYRKIAGTPDDLFRSAKFQESFWDASIRQWIRWLVGHNRYATVGDRTTENAHPFSHKHILLVHNGTLQKWASYIPELKNTEVDSEAITKSIAVRGLQETINRITGAWALAYFDQQAKTLNLIRNKERLLFLATSKKDNTVAFASERMMLDWILFRNRVEDYRIELLPEDTLYEYPLDDIEPKITKIIKKFYMPFQKKDKKQKAHQANNNEGMDSEFFTQGVGGHWELESGTWTWIPEVAEEPRGSLPRQEEKATTELAIAERAAKEIADARSDVGPPKEREFSKQYAPQDSLFDLKSQSTVLIDITDFAETGKALNTFQLTGHSNDYPDLEFRCFVKSRKKLDHMMFGDKLQGKVASLFRSERFDHPNLCYLAQNSIMPAWIDTKSGEVITCEYVEEEKRA